jgi:hypothetical protein
MQDSFSCPTTVAVRLTAPIDAVARPSWTFGSASLARKATPDAKPLGNLDRGNGSRKPADSRRDDSLGDWRGARKLRLRIGRPNAPDDRHESEPLIKYCTRRNCLDEGGDLLTAPRHDGSRTQIRSRAELCLAREAIRECPAILSRDGTTRRQRFRSAGGYNPGMRVRPQTEFRARRGNSVAPPTPRTRHPRV